MSDVLFSANIQKLLSESGYATDEIATDEDGDSHRINFKSADNKGAVYTDGGRIVMIKAKHTEPVKKIKKDYSPEVWRTDIDSAPKDGRRILLFDGFDMYVAAWGNCDMGNKKGWVYATFVTDWNYYEVVYNPTHWMEQPYPPSSSNNILKYVVKLEIGVWLAPIEGDPGRTLDVGKASLFDTKLDAVSALIDAREYRPFVGATVCKRLITKSADLHH